MDATSIEVAYALNEDGESTAALYVGMGGDEKLVVTLTPALFLQMILDSLQLRPWTS